MNFELRVQSEAILDMEEAFDWYEMQLPGLGSEFIAELEEGFNKLLLVLNFDVNLIG